MEVKTEITDTESKLHAYYIPHQAIKKKGRLHQELYLTQEKCLLQNLWRKEIQWDDPLPSHIEKEWKKLCEELPHLGSLKKPRLVLDSTLLQDEVDLHSFCDTSKKQHVPELDYLTEPEKETVVREWKIMPETNSNKETVLLNNDSSPVFDEVLELSNNYFKVINILSYIFRFIYNCKNKLKKVEPLTVAEFNESEIKLIKHAQKPLIDKKEISSNLSNLFPFVDGKE
ncbi:DUF1758 domain-containing protein [Trichonephila clavata]|uniref:DUF1758 domain-containing protein n=1 Tax=Trichonephila clavata TaxID=2740835 RepID=A0A8X6L251_TRICU|nr:DUF1758 domain-containing protein [Trichonephila clavata]